MPSNIANGKRPYQNQTILCKCTAKRFIKISMIVKYFCFINYSSKGGVYCLEGYFEIIVFIAMEIITHRLTRLLSIEVLFNSSQGDIDIRLDLRQETFFLTVYLLDKSFKDFILLPTKEYQVIGLSCLFVACKYHEIYPPTAH